MSFGHAPLVMTIREKCRMCYACVRECPAKAIRIQEGQASVVPERCIGCGNCVNVCTRKAKTVYNSINEVDRLMASGSPVAAIVAPSYPAEFTDMDTEQLVGVLKALGFHSVHEVSFGADLVAREYAKIIRTTENRYIGTTCPAVVSFVEKFYPNLIPYLMPVVSPMIAIARVLRTRLSPDTRIVFIGPCIGKKNEAYSNNVAGEVDSVITFRELHQMITTHRIDIKKIEKQSFDPPFGGTGGLFPISRGLLQASGLNEDLINSDVVVAEGSNNLWESIHAFRNHSGNARLLEILSCNGCIMGAGMTSKESILERRRHVSDTVRTRLATFDQKAWEIELKRYNELSLHRNFTPGELNIIPPTEEDIEAILIQMKKLTPEDELNCGACGYTTCRRHAVAIHLGFAEFEMCLPNTIEHLRKSNDQLEEANADLKRVREALSFTEKLASMGQLAAGIAHEVNNPLGVILIYANLLLERCQEQVDIGEDLKIIVEHADRCKKIVMGLLEFARQNKLFLQVADIPEFIEKVWRSVPPPASIETITEILTDTVQVEIDPDQMLQVMINLISNAYDAIPEQGQVFVRVYGDNYQVRFEVTDTGVGIPAENLDKIFEPFFTSKQVGKGTGLGLAVTHGIVKMHSGTITVTSNTDTTKGPTGTTFVVSIPRKGN